MEKLEITNDSPEFLSPSEGSIFMVSFKLKHRKETDTVFCDYIQLKTPAAKEMTLTPFNCKCKSFMVGNMPSDYSIKIGSLPLSISEVTALYQLPIPPWYYRREEDAKNLTLIERLSIDVGVTDIFSEMTGP